MKGFVRKYHYIFTTDLDATNEYTRLFSSSLVKHGKCRMGYESAHDEDVCKMKKQVFSYIGMRKRNAKCSVLNAGRCHITILAGPVGFQSRQQRNVLTSEH